MVKKIGISAIFIAAASGIFALTGSDSSEVLAFAIFLIVTFAIVLLGDRFPIVKDTTEKFFATGFRFLTWMAITLLALVLFNWLSQFMLASLSLVFQIAVFVIWGLVLAFAIRLIATERSRERLFSPQAPRDPVPRIGDPQYADSADHSDTIRSVKEKSEPKFKLGNITPVVYSFDLLGIAMMFFASLTFVLVQHGLVTLSGPPESPISYDLIVGFYLWHFLEAVPLLKVNDTLQWKAPLTYQSGLVGFVLLLFKLAVIIPVIAAFTWYWKKVSTENEKSK